MILTDKAKEDFLKYYNNHSNNYLLSFTDFEDLPTSVQNALIIEWLDSVNIFIQIDFENREPIFSYYVYSGKDICSGEYNANSRSEATQQAIIKANEIYNNLNTKENEK